MIVLSCLCRFEEDGSSPGLGDPAGAAAGTYSYQILSMAISQQPDI